MESTSWVAGHLTGGLGNRLFQHAAAAGLSERWKIPLVFYLPDCSETGHGAFDNVFKLFPTVPRITQQVPFQRLREVHNGVFTYEPFPSQPPAPCTTVDGYRQSELYFPSEGVHPDFEAALSKETCDRLTGQFNLVTGSQKQKAWFIHVRLGDYKILPHHQIDMGNYYSQAVQYIPKDATVFLFSDELQEYGNVLQSFFKQLGIDTVPVHLQDELESLYVMSQCWGGAIVANSTFSWWGAYCAKQNAPLQFQGIYPTMWGIGLPVAKDIIPSWGIRVQNE
jgi:hypothetical protein